VRFAASLDEGVTRDRGGLVWDGLGIAEKRSHDCERGTQECVRHNDFITQN
jgi:hypothetical protein